MDEIEQAIAWYQDSARDYATQLDAELEAEDRRPLVKREAVLRLMEQTNPLTNKVHSASSAEAVVESDPDYAEFRVMQRQGVVDKNTAFATMIAARLRAEALIAKLAHREVAA